jgi:hypothetical protein
MNEKKVEGLRVDIYKSGGRAFDGKGNFSSRLEEVTVVPSPDFPDVAGVFEPTEKAPAVAVVNRFVCGRHYLTAYPVVNGEIDTNCMAGGCFIYSCDGRFRDISDYPVPLHDRKE